jgi:class 3 adenylate cyclase/tetratricopeptide (TPR) repeat protein
MRHSDPSTWASSNAIESQRERLRRYLGGELAERLLAGAARRQDLFTAFAQLASTRYAVGTYLPQHLIRRALNGGASPWLEWVEGTLLFADVSGSTALAERLSALGREGTEIVTATLNDYFGTLIHAVQQNGGDLISFGGDALLVLFSGPDHARTAVATAYTLLGELADFERYVPGVGTFPLRMHIGVESGRVALVSAGLADAPRYSAMGATVRAVARAENLGGEGELVLGSKAWAAVAAFAEGEPAAPGFTRLTRLHLSAPHADPAADPATPTLTREALLGLADEISRLTPYLLPGLLDRILIDPQRSGVEADLRPVTVLFAQIDGLTALIERLPAAAAAAAVDAVLSPIQAAIQQYGGLINKIDLGEQGEKLLAIFGAPTALEDHAERAARAALALQAALRQSYGAGDSSAERPALALRIGLNTGNVFAGNVGADDRQEYTVMGDAVNVAARVMAHANWGELRCSAATAAQIADTILVSDPRLVQVKGKSEPLELLRIDGERTIELPRALRSGVLIGRDAEHAWLNERLERAMAGSGLAVRISGEAGLGKSRLSAEVLDTAGARGARVISVRCLSFNTNAPFAPWGDLLRELCGIHPDAPQAERAAKLEATLSAAGISAADWLPLLAELVRLDSADNVIVRSLDPQQRQARRFDLITQMLQAAARHAGGLVLLFDNLHWADQISLALWQHVAGQIGAAPILLIGLHRSTIAWPDATLADAANVLELGELAVEASTALLDHLGGQRLAPELRSQIIVRAGGNPLFLEELLRALEDNPALDTLPDSLSGLLLARIDRLDEKSRSLLRVAAVIGQRFPLTVLRSVQSDDYATLVRRLAHLDAEELTSLEREQPERVHLFRHALTQEVAYQSLLFARRRELHRRVGEHLERIHADVLAQARAQYAVDDASLVQIGRNGSLLSRASRVASAPIFLLAHHLRLSDQPERAVPYLLLAGHTARDDYANEQAIQYYRWTIEALADQPNDPRLWEAREALGDVLCTLGRYSEAIAEYAALLEPERHGDITTRGHAAVGSADDGKHSDGSELQLTSRRPPPTEAGFSPPHQPLPPAVAAEVLRSWGDALEKQGRYTEALEKLRAAEALAEAQINAVPPLLLAAIFADLGTVLRRLGMFDQALEVCHAGLARIRTDARSAEDERIEAELQQQLGTLYGMRGDYQRAEFHFRNALGALEAIDDLYGCARTLNNLGYLAQLQSNYSTSVANYAQAEELARKVSARYMLAAVQLNAAYAYYRLDRYAEATAAAQEAMQLAAAIGDQDGVAKGYNTLGIIAYNRGAYTTALEQYQQSLNLHRAMHADYEEGNTLFLMALVAIVRGEADGGRSLAEQALAIAERLQAPQLKVEALTALAEADLVTALQSIAGEARAPQLERAATYAAEAAGLADQLGSRLDYGVARRIAGQIAAARDEPADHHFQAAIDVFNALQSRFELAVTLARWGEICTACNDPQGAAYLEQARAIFTAIDAQGELERLGNATSPSSA